METGRSALQKKSQGTCDLGVILDNPEPRDPRKDLLCVGGRTRDTLREDVQEMKVSGSSSGFLEQKHSLNAAQGPTVPTHQKQFCHRLAPEWSLPGVPTSKWEKL
jgi:hypothetical protein